MSPSGTAQSFVIILSGCSIGGALFGLAFRGVRFAFGFGDLDLRLVSGFVFVSGEPKDRPLLVRMALSYPVVGGVAG